MFYCNFSDDTISQLRIGRFEHPHPRVQRKMEALLLKSAGLPHEQIAGLLGVCENTLLEYFAEYEEGGIERLTALNFYSPKSALVKHEDVIKSYFEKKPLATIKEAVAAIEKLTGIKRSCTQIRKFLKLIGLSRRKVGANPSKPFGVNAFNLAHECHRVNDILSLKRGDQPSAKNRLPFL